jgi:tetratricopeptide (TPR) repeat protein
LPVFFLPITTEFYDFNKNMLLMFSALGLLVLWAVKMLLEGGISFRHTKFDLPVLAVAISVLLTTFLVSPNRLETLWTSGATGTIVALTILYFVITQHVTRNTLVALATAGVFLALAAIYQFVGLGEALVMENSSLTWLRSKAWTPTGSLLSLALFLTLVLILISREFSRHFNSPADRNEQNTKDQPDKILLAWGFGGVVIILGLLVTGYQLVTNFKPLLLPYRSSWVIALEVLKFPVNLLFGVGTASFLEAFTRFRPLFYNASHLWAVRFGLAGSYLLHVLTTLGVLGLASWLLVASQIIKNKLWPLIVILVLFVLLPGNLLLLFLFYLLLAEASSQLMVREYNFTGHLNLARLVLALVLIFVSLTSWRLGRIYAAEAYFKKAVDAFNANKGGETYQLQIKAITLNPANDTYYQIYSKTNFLLANSLASKKEELTDQEKQNVTALVQQAINQAKNATGVNPGRVTNWENLANLYRGLINFAQSADQWTVQALGQALILDPVNPELRFTLGSVFYGLKNYDEAIRYFEQAINLKSDTANYYYNLAAAYKEKKEWSKALGSLQATMQLVPIDSADFKKLQDEITDVQDKLPKATPTPTGAITTGEKSELQKPEPLPSAKLEKPIELPADAAPATSSSPPLF